ncbi:MAG: hypothetical protein AABZ73_07320 [Pseudomonadota bacterium]|uniref:hypothetical protein n=1 Tax=Sphingobium sp. TaxID=1912891 RepID=UPI002E1CD38C
MQSWIWTVEAIAGFLTTGGAFVNKDDIDKLIGEMMTLVTAAFEDGAGLAVEGQVPRGVDMAQLIGTLHDHARRVMILLHACEVVGRSQTEQRTL